MKFEPVDEKDLAPVPKGFAEVGASDVAGGSKYPQPKSFTADDQSLGLQTPPVNIDQPMLKRLWDELNGPSGYGTEIERTKRGEQNEAANDVLHSAPGTLAASLAGGAVGAGVAGLAAKSAPKVAPALAGTLAEMQAAPRVAPKAAQTVSDRLAELAKGAITKTAGHATAGMVLGSLAHHPLAGAIAGVVAAPVAEVASKVAPALVSGVRSTVAAAAPPAATAVVKEAAGPMTNAIDKLRASAAGNPRAADLLAKIQAIKQPDLNTPSGTVTQGTLAGNP